LPNTDLPDPRNHNRAELHQEDPSFYKQLPEHHRFADSCTIQTQGGHLQHLQYNSTPWRIGETILWEPSLHLNIECIQWMPWLGCITRWMRWQRKKWGVQVPWSPKDAKSAGWIVASSAIWYHVLCENSDDFIIMNEVLLVSQFEGGKGEAFVLSIQEMKFTIHHLG